MGPDQGSLSSHHLLLTHLHPHRHRLRDAEEAQPAARTGPHQTLVNSRARSRTRARARGQAEPPVRLRPFPVAFLIFYPLIDGAVTRYAVKAGLWEGDQTLTL